MKLGLQNDYHLVYIWEGNEWKMAFNTPPGHYEYLLIPFGVPAVFLEWSPEANAALKALKDWFT